MSHPKSTSLKGAELYLEERRLARLRLRIAQTGAQLAAQRMLEHIADGGDLGDRHLKRLHKEQLRWMRLVVRYTRRIVGLKVLHYARHYGPGPTPESKTIERLAGDHR